MKAESSTKTKNLKKIFRCIQRHKSITRRDIQAETGLSWGAVSQFCSILLTSSIASENTSPGNSANGKSGAEIFLNPSDFFLIGLDFTFSYAYGTLFNLQGESLDSYSVPIRNPELILDYLTMITEAIICKQTDTIHFLAIGVSVPGAADSTHSTLKTSIFSDKWSNLPIRQVLEKQFHLPVYVYSDAECDLVAEKYFGIIAQNNFTNAALVSLNYGVGMAWMHHNKVYFSEDRHQCELGHFKVRPGGTLCNCGKRGCLEMYSSPIGLSTQLREEVERGASTSVTSGDNTDALYKTIALHAKSGDILSRHLFEQAGELLGNSCAAACSLLEPEVLIIYGLMQQDLELWKDKFEECFFANVFPRCNTRLIYSSLTTAAPMLGAAFTALDALLTSFLAEALELSNQAK